MINIIEYKLEFTYNIQNIYIWCDNFKLDEEWEILRINKCRKLEKVYMDRSPYIKPKDNYEIALYTKNKWIYLNNGIGITTNSNENLEIKNLKIENIKATPIITTYKFKFELQIILIICSKIEDTEIIESRKINKYNTKIIYKDLVFKMYDDIIIYKGENIVEFEIFCKELKCRYELEVNTYKELFQYCDEYKKDLYMSLAYKTWFRAKRLNQKEWPLISETEKENGLKFQNVWYYHDKYKIGLAKRKDDNDEIYIPKIYKDIKNNNKHKLPYSIKTKNYKNVKFIKMWEGEDCTIIDYRGNIIETDENPKYIVYENMIIGKTEEKYKFKGKVQILDKKGKVTMIINDDDKLEQCNNIRISKIKTVPWNYKHILHDYNKLGRLIEGDYTDLMHIGIVDENGKDIISWSNIDNLYIGKAIETKRLITFKNQNNVNINTI